jgi:hypothetical protein
MSDVNMSRDFIVVVDSWGYVYYGHKSQADKIDTSIEWPILSVDTASEAETLKVLFCQRDFPDQEDAHWFLPGFQCTKEDLPFAQDRFVNGYAQLRKNYHNE